MKCRISSPEALTPKGIKFVFTCDHEPKDVFFIEELHKHASLIKDSLSNTLNLRDLKIVFSENEVIGSDYILYSYKVFCRKDYVGTCRFVTYNNKLIKSLCTISEGVGFGRA
ncbi:MAG: hypothetical protein QN229_00565 [Desulfurococcaceae archaeon TW002]